jgi:cyanate permease
VHRGALPAQPGSRAGATAGFALVTTIAHVISAMGLSLIGVVKDATGGFRDALLLGGIYLLVTPVGIFVLRRSQEKRADAPS